MPQDAWSRLRDDIAAYRTGHFTARNKTLSVVKRALQQHGREASEAEETPTTLAKCKPGWEDLGTLDAGKTYFNADPAAANETSSPALDIAADVDANVQFKWPQNRFLPCNCGRDEC